MPVKVLHMPEKDTAFNLNFSKTKRKTFPMVVEGRVDFWGVGELLTSGYLCAPGLERPMKNVRAEVKGTEGASGALGGRFGPSLSSVELKSNMSRGRCL